MNRIFVPPIKCQGIKTKLVPDIRHIAGSINFSRWIEPFFGSGVVGFNIRPKTALFSDSNPHLIRFYSDLQRQIIDPVSVKKYLENEGPLLEKTEGEHYYVIRERFNREPTSLDFLFLNRSCFNGMIRFNAKGGFNVPFCRKPTRFAQAYITKIVNQVKHIQEMILHNQYSFVCQSFEKSINSASPNDLIYCDPPYIGRHVDYFDSWNESQEKLLHDLLTNSGSKFMLSTWHSNEFRKNTYLETLWSDLHVLTKEHFYHVGASEENRNPMLEAILINFSSGLPTSIHKNDLQPQLF